MIIIPIMFAVGIVNFSCSLISAQAEKKEASRGQSAKSNVESESKAKADLTPKWAVQSPGYVGKVTGDTIFERLAATDRKAWDELEKSMRAGDLHGMKELANSARVAELDNGTQVRILDSPFLARFYEVRVESGDFEGLKLFILKKSVW